jgi:transcriptional regulator NrdR family protein
MKCPICDAWSTVRETRQNKRLGYIRRRECANEHRFTTQEVVVKDQLKCLNKESHDGRERQQDATAA